MSICYIDTETCGYHGPIILIQWTLDDGSIHLHNVWKNPIQETIDLIDMIMEHPVCGFNISFDHFHFCQCYTTLQLLGSKVGWEEFPEDHIDAYAVCEYDARAGVCLKPVAALDLMLHARKGPYQSTMNRGDIRIRRVPESLAYELANELAKRIPLKDLYFAKKKNKKERWKIYDVKNDIGQIIEGFKDVVLKFSPSSALKALAGDALDIDVDRILMFADVNVPKEYLPVEYGYAPFAMAIGKPGAWNGAWPDVIWRHIRHWEYNDLAREYAEDDVKYLRLLREYFGNPEPGDDDSELACMVGAVRWRGFSIDVDQIAKMRRKEEEFLANIPFNYNSVPVVRRYLEQVLDETSKAVIQGSTKKFILEDLSKWTKEEVCPKCQGMGELRSPISSEMEPCPDCDEGLIPGIEPHPVAARATLILHARRGKKRIELFNKLLLAGRFHADLNVIGALSSRMSGAGGLNAQGINKEKEIRSCFLLADAGLVLVGGDFDGFEVVLMDAAYGDPDLRKQLEARRPCAFCDSKVHQACQGNGCDDCADGKCYECDENCTQPTKIHALFGIHLFPPKTYEQILATKTLPEGENLYSRSKNGVFCIAYGGNEYSLQNRVGISEKAANEGYQTWIKKYKVWGEERQKIFDMFCSMRQPGGLKTKVVWHEPASYIESLFGFKRYFTIENQVVRALFQLAEDPPKDWQQLKIKVVRRDTVQSACGALRSALYGAAFQAQAANMRAAGNHVIQSAGATLTKGLQRRIWDVQPPGANNWRVQPLNIHDEIMCPTHPKYIEQVAKVQKDFIEENRDKVPLISMGWGRLKSWGEK